MAEHRFCKPGVVSSTLTASFGLRALSCVHLGRPLTRKSYIMDPSRKPVPVLVGAAGPRRGVDLTTGSWPSGQWHQTVNLADFVLRRFESCAAHLRSRV